jgi:hypothetical protein
VVRYIAKDLFPIQEKIQHSNPVTTSEQLWNENRPHIARPTGD